MLKLMWRWRGRGVAVEWVEMMVELTGDGGSYVLTSEAVGWWWRWWGRARGHGVAVELMGQQWRPRADSGTGGDDGAGGGCWSSCGDGGGCGVMLEVMG